MLAKLIRLFVAMLVTISVIAAPRPALALDLGLTPSHVYSMWTNINNCLLTLAQTEQGSSGELQSIGTLQPRVFEGKRPVDVLEQVIVFRSKLDVLRQRAQLAETQKFAGTYEDVTPSVVYLHSSLIINSLVEYLIARSPPDQLVSQFYKRHEMDGRTPSDVFSLVDLADRRVDFLLEQAGTP